MYICAPEHHTGSPVGISCVKRVFLDPHDEPHKLSCPAMVCAPASIWSWWHGRCKTFFARIPDDRFSGGGTGNLFVASNPGIDHVLVEQQRLPLLLRSLRPDREMSH